MSAIPRIALVTFYDSIALGVRNLHAVLTRAGYPTDLIFFREQISLQRPYASEKEYRLLLELIQAINPDLLGFSFRSFAFKIASRLTREIKQRLPAMIVWGGTHPTLVPEECLAIADAVCVGEGEGALLELAQALQSGQEIAGIPNLWVRQDAQVIRNPLRPLIQNLDSLPFPILGDQGKFFIENDQLLHQDPYLGPKNAGYYFVAASRGCPYACDYCCNSALRQIYRGAGPYVRKRSPDHILAELEMARRTFQLKTIGFVDEVFSLDQAWNFEICRGYRERIGVPFHCDLHPQIIDDELIAAMRAANLTLAAIGVQSGSERIRRELYHRMMSNSEILRAGQLLHQHQIIPSYHFILDNPYETPEDLAATLDLVCQLPRPFNLDIFSLTFFPGTEITKRALADHLISPDQIEGRAEKTLTGMRYSLPRALNPLNAFYLLLLGFSLLKFDWQTLRLGYYITGTFQSSRHLIPPRTLRFLGRHSLFRQHPRLLKIPLEYAIHFGNLLLAPFRRLRRLWNSASTLT